MRPMSAVLLVGNWKLVSWQVVTGDEAKDLFGTKPKGYMILTREGRAMTVTTAEARTPGDSEPERAALPQVHAGLHGQISYRRQ